jgi:hypothetical protein
MSAKRTKEGGGPPLWVEAAVAVSLLLLVALIAYPLGFIVRDPQPAIPMVPICSGGQVVWVEEGELRSLGPSMFGED